MNRPLSSSPHKPPNTESAGPTSAGAGGTRSHHSPWPALQSSSHRTGLPPIAIGPTWPNNPTPSISRSPFSPTHSTFTHNQAAANRYSNSWQSFATSAQPLQSPSASGQYTTSSAYPGQRSRAATGASSPRIASPLTGLSSPFQAISGGAFGGGGGAARLARHSPSLSSSTVGSPTSSGGGQLNSLLLTQLNILLSTVKDSNFDLQADKIRKLLDENGMELFETYFRRLLSNSWSLVFPHHPRPASSQANAETYRLLEQEVQKLRTDPRQAERIASAFGSHDLDIDLTAFADHFQLDQVTRAALLLACRLAANGDLRSRADQILTSNTQPFLSTLANPPSGPTGAIHDDVSPQVLALIIERLDQDPPHEWSERQKEDLSYAVKVHYQKLNSRLPPAVEAAMYLNELLQLPDSRLARVVQRAGPRATASLDACRDMLAVVETRDISYPQIANALLFLVISQNGEAYDAGVFVEGLRQHKAGLKIDWTDVVQGFDKEHLRVTKKQFLGLYNALLPLAREYANFDIQHLWGGQWTFPATQLSFVTAFLSTTSEELDVAQIPDFRQCFTLADYADAPEGIKAYAAEAVKYPLVSRDATEALFVMIFRSQEAYNEAQMLSIPETIINPNMTIFLCAASAVPKPWGALQDQALKQLFYPFLMKQHPNYDFVMHSLWMHDKTWVAQRLVEFYQTDSTLLGLVHEHAVEHGWLDLLLTIHSNFALDLAALAHSKGQYDIVEWAQPLIHQLGHGPFAKALFDFMRPKLDDEIITQKERVPPTTVPLSLKTVYAMLMLLAELVREEELGPFYRQCLQTYPRLFNYGENDRRDSILEANCANGHALPEDADEKMQERYKKMYGGEATPDDIKNELKVLKESDDPADQDLFAVMLQGLFDEYNCFGEYPLEALATTAVLFGGLLAYHIPSSVAEHAAIFMILEAVSEYGPEDSMYKFGLQAMVHMSSRLKEWPHVAERITQIPSLRGTQVVPVAEAVLKELQQETSGLNGDTVNGLTNGALDEEFPADSPTPPFTSIRPDPPLQAEMYEEPNEDVSDKVMFALNNVSMRNLDEKFKDLETLEETHHQWFAKYLVEELAKSQPNFQSLYLQLLEKFDRKMLWAEVLRETYVSCARMLNAPSTMEKMPERQSLKNLAGWLGALTLARNQPVLHRNLSFKDLLIEGHDTQRLLVAIPFTCKALWHARVSKVFRPPNPWLMELLGLMSELYNTVDLKLNLKFEIEVLCKDLDQDIKKIEPLQIIRARPLMPENNLLQPYVGDGGPDGFGDMHLMQLSKRPPNERFSPEAVIQALPDLGGMLQIPTAAGNITQPQLRGIFVNAAQRAIYEIIAPVVERSVTIAAISTAELIQKDFATEADVEKLRNSAHTVVKALSGSLALVTCKEPLRMSIMNNIRIFAQQNVHDPLPEGQIIMFVNDNIDTVCGLVEHAAEEHSLAEIDAQLAQAIEERERHNEQRPNELFNNPPVSRWAQLIPEPFRQDPQGVNANGLNRQQLGLYEDFGRQARITPTTHANSVSQDARGQLPDMLADTYLPNLPTPAEAPALPRPTPQLQRLQMQSAQGQHQVNGYSDGPDSGRRILSLLHELQQAAQEAQEDSINEVGEATAIRRIFEQLIALLDSSVQRDELTIAAGEHCLSVIYHTAQKRLEVEVFVRLMAQLCRMSTHAARVLMMYLANQEDDKAFNAIAVVALANEGMVDLQHVDIRTAKALKQKRPAVVGFLRQLLEETLISENAIAMRTDFVMTYEGISQWLAEDPDNESLRDIMSRLQLESTQQNGVPSSPQDDERDHIEYVFEEWVRMQQRKDIPEHRHVAFLKQLNKFHIVDNPEKSVVFYRACLEMAGSAFERVTNAPYATPDAAYVHIDAFARLVAYSVLYHSPINGEAPHDKARVLGGVIALIVMVMADHHNKQRERWNSRIYFRLFSSLLCELNDKRHSMSPAEQQAMSQETFGKVLLLLQPRYFPNFTYPWLALISHRLVITSFLSGAGRSNGGWAHFAGILGTLFESLGQLFSIPEASTVIQDYYKGVIKFLLTLHHDFPEFLVEHHFELNSSIPHGLAQLHNIINSAAPRPIEQPDPLTPGLKINRLETIRSPPIVHGNQDVLLAELGIKDAIDRVYESGDISNDDFSKILDALALGDGPADARRANAFVIYLGIQATTSSSVFSSAAPPARLLERLLRESRPAARYELISAMINQVRYVNAHTHYFSTALQHMFTVAAEDLQEQIMRVMMERLIVPRPHPWGIIVMILELVKNSTTDLWELPWLRNASQVQSMLMNLAQSAPSQGPGMLPGRLPRSPLGPPTMLQH
ncbi:hypothetical protein BAUCODRAFT_159617 [Baudoinia panamericana UAMH 10762]|uniref:General negative regulator of transcription subunit 1 n=1 Tax=Baudoinia panamericana (strain UAMH 10762) TaxID=717646 RepID=M2M920_BAUPA|nr:uncharacterized protein BAUCODRAFT_159617 [Baudoinia panamericana UAMH 10762]EMC92891.1 hypothetical protein BAUCODRAFT_159617 [Baudoinia panamericana UAMH 10762]